MLGNNDTATTNQLVSRKSKPILSPFNWAFSDLFRNYNFYGSIGGIQTKLRTRDDTLLGSQEIKQMVKTNQSMFITVCDREVGRQNDVICYISQRCLDHISRTCESVILHNKD